ncbi:type B diterpene cyclase [Streptosporangium fragile]|uniref:Type B diterpene cyclase n=1 Tax=Streptosporangium fragile TaxID=46186 RepID=A0ABP6IAG5_9ACTN
MMDEVSSPLATHVAPSAADDVVAGLTAHPRGQISPSVYETSRVTTLAPWLPGLGGRLGFLLRAQHPDGTWGAPGGYALIPTLSATEALLTTLRRWQSRALPDPSGVEYGKLAAAAGRGLSALLALPDRGGSVPLPDTVAAELIAPALVAEVNAHLDRLTHDPIAGLDARGSGARLSSPRTADPETLGRVRAHLRGGGDIPAKLWHSLEVLGGLAGAAGSVRPVAGAVCCSPAATAAWLGPQPDTLRFGPSIAYLHAAAAPHGGAVPSVLPVTAFERIWTVGTLIGAGIDVRVPPSLIAGLEDRLDAGALGGAPGLPPDADTTSAALALLSRVGRPRSPDCLWEFELDDHFCCWLGERTPSPTANAHVLEAFGEHARRAPGHADRHRAAMDKVSSWLVGVQHPDGSWTDKWHASPYYATSHCALALDRMAGGHADSAVLRAIDWVLATQNADGSWGIWGGTGEETAYAVHILLRTRHGRADAEARRAAARGGAFLRRQDAGRHPALWQDKDLYTPVAICEAARLAALHLVGEHAA